MDCQNIQFIYNSIVFNTDHILPMIATYIGLGNISQKMNAKRFDSTQIQTWRDRAGDKVGAEARGIGKTIHPHPPLGESIGMVAVVGHGRCMDLPPGKKKTLRTAKKKPPTWTDGGFFDG